MPRAKGYTAIDAQWCNLTLGWKTSLRIVQDISFSSNESWVLRRNWSYLWMGASLANKNLLAKKIFTNVDTHISLLISLDLFLVDCVVTLTLRTPCPVLCFVSVSYTLFFKKKFLWMQKRTNKEHHLYWLIFLMESWTYLQTKALILENRKFSAASFYMDSLPPPPPKGDGRLRSGGFRLGEKVAQTFNSELETKFAFLNGTLLIWHQSMHAKQLRWAFFIFVNDCIVTSGECYV